MNQSNGICNESCGVDDFLQETRCSRSVPHPTGLDWPNRFSRRSSLLRGDARTSWRVLARSAGVGRSRPVAGSPEKKLAQDVPATRIHADTKNPWRGHTSRGLRECKIVYTSPFPRKRAVRRRLRAVCLRQTATSNQFDCVLKTALLWDGKARLTDKVKMKSQHRKHT